LGAAVAADLPPIPAPQDVAFPGTITLTVDATDLDRRIYNVQERIPVHGGEHLVLLYPQWLPGQHGPAGRADKLAGLTIQAGGKRVEWVRDPGNVFAFHVDVPADADALDLTFQYMSALNSGQGRVVMAPSLLDLSWDSVVLYPAGYYARQIAVSAAARLPADWQFGTALETENAGGNVTRFKRVSLETLVDSPVLAGRYFKRLDLTHDSVPVHLDIVAERADLLDAKPVQIAVHRGLVEQAERLFGTQHFAHYDFLLGLSDDLTAMGLEHHQSSEDLLVPGYFSEWDKTVDLRDFLPHEFVHSWNGKFRRPADLWTPNYNVPMRDSLLWVYEGQTQYWGLVLAARSGLMSRDEVLGDIAYAAAALANRAGRAWRNLQDTTNDPVMAQRRGLSSRSWQRGEDYYAEGMLIWLDADTLIRERSHGRRSLDDFAHAFFGIDPGSTTPVTYTFDDVVAALNAVEPYDWAAFLRARLDGHGAAPLDGIARGGYKLEYSDAMSSFQKSAGARRKQLDVAFAIGLVVGSDGKVVDVLHDSLADKAALTAGTRILAVNGTAYDGDLLTSAITDAKTSGAPIELIVRTDDHFRTVRLDYRGGLRFPHLEHDTGGTATLDAILAAKR
jgi:predicted metalloprotease with PDZ domain